jgi:hypothetical protein
MLPNDKTNQGARPAASTPRTHPIDSDLIVTGERQQPCFEKKRKTTTSLLDDVSTFVCYFSDRWSMLKKGQNPGFLISY